MKIYFAGSIRGGRDDAALYAQVIEMLTTYGTVLTEHLGDSALSAHGEVTRTDKDIYERDMDWVRESDVVIAEVSTPSLGVGYEIGQAQAMGKPILCLYRETEGKRLSAMIAGNASLTIGTYSNLEEAESQVRAFVESIQKSAG